jgi:hypothetical protein
VASADWPGLFQGVLALDETDRLAVTRDERRLGTFRFPPPVGSITHAHLFCAYQV